MPITRNAEVVKRDKGLKADPKNNIRQVKTVGPEAATQNAVSEPTGSPIEKAAAKGAPTVDDSELYTVDKENETVYGLVDQYSDKNNAVMKREAQKGIDMAASRGLTNSSIASGNAIGKVLDKTTEWATADSASNNARKTESLRAATSKYGTDVSAEASKYSSDQQLEGTKIQSAAQIKATQISAAAQVQSSSISANAQVQVAGVNATSAEKISASQEATKQLGFKVDLALANLDAASAVQVEQVKGQYLAASNGQTGSMTASTQNQMAYLTAIGNIDQTASPTTQQEQMDRIETAYANNNTAIATWSTGGPNAPQVFTGQGAAADPMANQTYSPVNAGDTGSVNDGSPAAGGGASSVTGKPWTMMNNAEKYAHNKSKGLSIAQYGPNDVAAGEAWLKANT